MCGKTAVLAENSVSAETPKRKKTEISKPKPKQAEIFGRNGTETVSVCLITDYTQSGQKGTSDFFCLGNVPYFPLVKCPKKSSQA